MIWVFRRAGEFVEVRVLKYIYYRVETSFPKAMDAEKSEVMYYLTISVHLFFQILRFFQFHFSTI